LLAPLKTSKSMCLTQDLQKRRWLPALILEVNHRNSVGWAIQAKLSQLVLMIAMRDNGLSMILEVTYLSQLLDKSLTTILLQCRCIMILQMSYWSYKTKGKLSHSSFIFRIQIQILSWLIWHSTKPKTILITCTSCRKSMWISQIMNLLEAWECPLLWKALSISHSRSQIKLRSLEMTCTLLA
jgi:hypothetical protein